MIVDIKKEFESYNYTLREKVYKTIKSQIIKGNIKPGERIYEEKLSKIFKISRAPIREVLILLYKEGFIKLIPRKGSIVSNVNFQGIMDLYDLREVLEYFAIQRSINKISLEELESIEKEFKVFLENHADKSSKEIFNNLNNRFHLLICKYCKNKELIKALIGIQEKISWYRNLFSYNHPNYYKKSSEEHLEIIQALKIKDKKSSYRILKNHYIRARKLFSNDFFDSSHQSS